MAENGQRVRLIRCTDPHVTLEPGIEGTLQFVDSLGTVHVRWDNGCFLGLIPGHDSWEWLVEFRPGGGT